MSKASLLPLIAKVVERDRGGDVARAHIILYTCVQYIT
jgi:hypothetical protein